MIGSLDALHNIVANYMLHNYRDKIKELATEEIADHTISHTYSLSKYYYRLNALLKQPDKDYIALQIDLTRAYPNSSRKHIRKQLQHHLPEFVSIFDCLYSTPNQHQLKIKER